MLKPINALLIIGVASFALYEQRTQDPDFLRAVVMLGLGAVILFCIVSIIVYRSDASIEQEQKQIEQATRLEQEIMDTDYNWISGELEKEIAERGERERWELYLELITEMKISNLEYEHFISRNDEMSVDFMSKKENHQLAIDSAMSALKKQRIVVFANTLHTIVRKSKIDNISKWDGSFFVDENEDGTYSVRLPMWFEKDGATKECILSGDAFPTKVQTEIDVAATAMFGSAFN